MLPSFCVVLGNLHGARLTPKGGSGLPHWTTLCLENPNKVARTWNQTGGTPLSQTGMKQQGHVFLLPHHEHPLIQTHQLILLSSLLSAKIITTNYYILLSHTHTDTQTEWKHLLSVKLF